MMEVIS